MYALILRSGLCSRVTVLQYDLGAKAVVACGVKVVSQAAAARGWSPPPTY